MKLNVKTFSGYVKKKEMGGGVMRGGGRKGRKGEESRMMSERQGKQPGERRCCQGDRREE